MAPQLLPYAPFHGPCSYNLKRKIAGLPPVTRDWYEARKAQLLASSATPVQKVRAAVGPRLGRLPLRSRATATQHVAARLRGMQPPAPSALSHPQLPNHAPACVPQVWFDPLTRRKFYSENTYLAFSR